MLSTLSTNAVTAKIRAMRSRRITPDQYRELISKKSVQDLAAYLQSETRYSETLSGVQPHSIHRGQLENLLSEQRYSEDAKLMRYIPKTTPNFYEFYIVPAEIEQILKMIRLINDDTPELFALQYPRYILPFVSVDFDRISKVRDFNGLLEALSGTRYVSWLESCKPAGGGKADYATCDTAMFTRYYGQMYDIIEQSFKGDAKHTLNRIFGVTTQLRNTVVIFRVKKYFPDTSREELERRLLPMRNRTARRELLSLIDTPNSDAFVSELKRSQFSKDFENADFDYVEYRENAITNEMMTRLLYTSEDAPVCFVAYMTLSTIETNNLIKIIESVYYNLSSDETKKLLIMGGE
ncbi:MAG: V-type ATPase subunit [Oscillospiraceae bacterium]|jgi:V/A-type H+-transporting ATPase subunit C|nr:V-type ATPase subunit [Oscillospiraceae bacterium]